MTATLRQDGEGFEFETEAMCGRLVPGGAYHGVWQLQDKASGRELIHPEYSALNLFRLFAVNQGMGQPRFMERSVSCDGRTMRICWERTDAHHAAIEAGYTITGPTAIDLEVDVRIMGSYAGYEVFLSSYFDPILRPFVYLKGGRYGNSDVDRELVCPTFSEVFKGTVVVFARDGHMARRCIDGRWDRSEHNAPTVQMCPLRYYSLPVAYLADEANDRAVAFMVQRENCASISTRYHAEDDADKMTPYSAFDFSLFGCDVLPQDHLRVRMRMQLVSLNQDEDGPLQAYDAFLKEQGR